MVGSAGHPASWWHRVKARRPCGEEGTSLIELVVGMMLMTIFGGMFTGAVVMMNSATNKAQAVNNTSSQLNQAFLTLDKTVRYAAAISPPGCPACTTATTPGDWYVELRTTNSGSEVCTQLRVDITKQQLQRRTWTVTNSVPSPVNPSFTPVASGITNTVSADLTFVLKTPPANVHFQQLTINLMSKSGSGSAQTPSSSSFTVTAYNSTFPAPTVPICQEQGRP